MTAEAPMPLLQAKTYREFLAAAFQELQAREAKFSFALFSRRAGFASRSYPRDVLAGKRRISAATLPSFIRGLGLEGDRKEYFTLLVAIEEEDCNPDRLTPEKLRRKLERLRSRAEGRSSIPLEGIDFYRRQTWLYIYASLGSAEDGATIEQISRRTRLARGSLRPELAAMEKLGILRAAGGRYFSRDHHLIFRDQGGSSFFRQHYLSSLVDAIQDATQRFDTRDRLFLNSVLSVREADLPRLREKLRQLLEGFIDSSANDEGDRLANLSIAFWPRV